MTDLLAKITGNRIIIFLFLLLILVSLCMYYYDNFRLYQEHPGTYTIMTSYPEGELVAVSGKVTETNINGFLIEDNFKGKNVIYKIISNEKVNPGDQAQVLGVLGPDYSINSQVMKISPAWKYNFLLLRSFIAFLFLVFIFFRYWKFDLEDKVFVRRR